MASVAQVEEQLIRDTVALSRTGSLWFCIVVTDSVPGRNAKDLACRSTDRILEHFGIYLLTY